MNENEKLVEVSSCPFCGSKSLLLEKDTIFFCIYCSHCGASGPVEKRDIDAVHAWNDRNIVLFPLTIKGFGKK